MAAMELSVRVRIAEKDWSRVQVIAARRGIKPGAVAREAVLLFLEKEEKRLELLTSPISKAA